MTSTATVRKDCQQDIAFLNTLESAVMNSRDTSPKDKAWTVEGIHRIKFYLHQNVDACDQIDVQNHASVGILLFWNILFGIVLLSLHISW